MIIHARDRTMDFISCDYCAMVSEHEYSSVVVSVSVGLEYRDL